MQPEKVIIVDCNAVCYAAYYTAGHLSYGNQETGIIYSFFNQILHLCKMQQAAHIAFCWDSRQSRRKLIFPEYKSNRTKTDPQLLRALKQFTKLRKEVLPRLGFANVFHFTGFEADDLIASICANKSLEQECIIMSGDQDLYQLLSDKVSMYRVAKRKIYTVWDFQNEYGIIPVFWLSVKAIAGCHSDALPGIPGIGEKTALDYMKNLLSPKKCEKIESSDGKHVIKRNMDLVRLPLQGTPKIKMKWKTRPDFAEWVAVCEELGFRSFLSHMEDWEAIYAGIVPRELALSKIRIGKKSSIPNNSSSPE